MKKLFLILLANSILIADPIEINNFTDHNFHAAVYYKCRNEIFRSSTVYNIPSNNSIKAERPGLKYGCALTFYDRQLAISLNSEQLKSKLSPNEFQVLRNINIGNKTGSTYYIIKNKDKIELRDFLDQHIIADLKKGAQKIKETVTEPLSQAVQNQLLEYPLRQEVAELRISDDISDKEKEFLKNRSPITKQAIGNIVGKEIQNNKEPVIAICASGGGYRATIATLGFVLGLQEIGVLDAVTYFSALSGSTWFLAPYIQSGLNLNDFKEFLKRRMSIHIKQAKINTSNLISNLALKKSFGQELSLIDIFGTLLGSIFLGESGNLFNIYLSDQSKLISNGKYPYTIHNGIITKKPYTWAEFTPDEIGVDLWKTYIPTWAFNRKFSNGKSINFAIEPALQFLMGIWGSAFNVNFEELLKEVSKKRNIPRIANLALEALDIHGVRVMPAIIKNFTHNKIGLPRDNDKTLTFIDAGIDFNLPLVPLFREARKVNIIIVLDSSANTEGAPELKKAIEYLTKRGYSVPNIDYHNISSKTASVFKGDINTPTIIYLPLVKNTLNISHLNPDNCKSGFCSTYSFQYTPDQFEALSNLTRSNVIDNKDLIHQVIKDYIAT